MTYNRCSTLCSMHLNMHTYTSNNDDADLERPFNRNKNAFLTAKGCKDHIEKNSYHYNDPIDYLNCAWRNPEMELISKFLCGLVGKEPHK